MLLIFFTDVQFLGGFFFFFFFFKEKGMVASLGAP